MNCEGPDERSEQPSSVPPRPHLGIDRIGRTVGALNLQWARQALYPGAGELKGEIV
jgi:hypothetical protein